MVESLWDTHTRTHTHTLHHHSCHSHCPTTCHKLDCPVQSPITQRVIQSHTHTHASYVEGMGFRGAGESGFFSTELLQAGPGEARGQGPLPISPSAGPQGPTGWGVQSRHVNVTWKPRAATLPEGGNTKQKKYLILHSADHPNFTIGEDVDNSGLPVLSPGSFPLEPPPAPPHHTNKGSAPLGSLLFSRPVPPEQLPQQATPRAASAP